MDALNASRAVVLACWPSTDPLLAGVGADPALFELAGKPLVRRVVERLKQWGGEGAEEIVGREEHVVFALPRELRAAAKTQPGDANAV